MKWEYMVVQLTVKLDTDVVSVALEKLSAVLNEYGAHGWEVCGITAGSVYCFKRPV